LEHAGADIPTKKTNPQRDNHNEPSKRDEGNPQAWNNLVAITIVSIWEARNKCKFENGSFDTQTILRLQAQKIKQSGIDMQHSTNTAIRLLGDRWIEHCPE
jgi:hypothetical protein